MQVEYAFLADAAEAPNIGKFYVIGGGIDEIRTPSFPAKHPYMSLVAAVRLHPAECDRQHRLEIELWDPDGQRVGPQFNFDISAQRLPEAPMRSRLVTVVLNMVGMEFARPGTYEFHIVVDGQHLKELPLYLVLVPQPQPNP